MKVTIWIAFTNVSHDVSCLWYYVQFPFNFYLSTELHQIPKIRDFFIKKLMFHNCDVSHHSAICLWYSIPFWFFCFNCIKFQTAGKYSSKLKVINVNIYLHSSEHFTGIIIEKHACEPNSVSTVLTGVNKLDMTFDPYLLGHVLAQSSVTMDRVLCVVVPLKSIEVDNVLQGEFVSIIPNEPWNDLWPLICWVISWSCVSEPTQLILCIMV